MAGCNSFVATISCFRRGAVALPVRCTYCVPPCCSQSSAAFQRLPSVAVQVRVRARELYEAALKLACRPWPRKDQLSYLRSRVQRPHEDQTIALSHFDDDSGGSVQLWRCQSTQAALWKYQYGMAGMALWNKALGCGDGVVCMVEKWKAL